MAREGQGYPCKRHDMMMMMMISYSPKLRLFTYNLGRITVIIICVHSALVSNIYTDAYCVLYVDIFNEQGLPKCRYENIKLLGK